MYRISLLFKKAYIRRICVFFILFVFVFQFILSCNSTFIVLGDSKTYTKDYGVFVCDGINAEALEADVDDDFNPSSASLFSESDYVNISHDDTMYVEDHSESEHMHQLHLFAFDIFGTSSDSVGEIIENISEIDITWKGTGGFEPIFSTEDSGFENISYSLWVKENDNYVLKTKGESSSEAGVSVQYTSDFDELLSGDGRIYVAARSGYGDASSVSSSWIRSYYVELKIIYRGSLDVFEVSNPDSVVEDESFVATVESNGNPVEGAKIVFNSKSHYTGKDGVAIINSPSVDSDTSYTLYVSKDGYSDVSSSILVLDNDVSYPELDVDAPSFIWEGKVLDVTVTAVGIPVSDVSISFNGVSYVTGSSGVVSLVAPLVSSDKSFSVVASKSGYSSGSASVLVLDNESSVVDPELSVSAPVSVYEDESFDVTVTSDDVPMSGVSVSFDGTSVETDSSGVVSFVAPLVDSKTGFVITVSKSGFVSDTCVVSVLDSTMTDVLLLYPVGGETLSGVVSVSWDVVNPPAVNIADPGSVASASLYYKQVSGSWVSVVAGLGLSVESYAWDTIGLVDGSYLLKVVLSVNDVLYEGVSSVFYVENEDVVDDGWVYGTVYYMKNGVKTSLDDVTVCVSSDSTTGYQSNKCKITNEKGEYIRYITPGVYTVSATKPGYVSQTYENIQISESKGKNIDFILEKIAVEQPESKTYTDYTIDQEIKKGLVFGKVDISSDEDQVFVYDNVDVNILSSDISSDDGLNIVLSGEGTPGTKLVIYLGVIENPQDLVVNYDGVQINQTTDFESFFSLGYNKSEYVLATLSDSEGVKTALIINIPHYSEHTIQISLPKVIIETLSNTTIILVYLAMIILTLIAAIIHMKTIWKK